MTPEQEKEMLELARANYRMQRRILAALVIPGFFVVIFGIFSVVAWLVPFLTGYGNW